MFDRKTPSFCLFSFFDSFLFCFGGWSREWDSGETGEDGKGKDGGTTTHPFFRKWLRHMASKYSYIFPGSVPLCTQQLSSGVEAFSAL